MIITVLLSLSLVFWTLPAAAVPGQCTLTWDLVTTYVDDSPATITEYRLYLSNQPGQYTNPPVAVVDAPPIQLSCQGKRYWVVTAVDGQGIESDYSNELLTKQANAPQALRTQ